MQNENPQSLPGAVPEPDSGPEQPVCRIGPRPKVESVQVLRQETTPIEGGKEYSYAWRTKTKDGAASEVRSFATRIDTVDGYTMDLDMTVARQAPGAEPDASPRQSQRTIKVHGRKGEVRGNVRMDEVTVTITSPDGSTHSQTMTTPVRLDLGHLETMDFAELLKTPPEKWLAPAPPESADE